MENKTITKLAKKYNLTYEKINNLFYRFTFKNYDEFSLFFHIFLNKKNLHVESNYPTLSVNVWDLDTWENFKERNIKKSDLVEMFFQALRNGKTQEQARATQEEYCNMHPDYCSAFQEIYG